MTDPLSRLRAGLDRDEAIARAATTISGESWSVCRIPYEGIMTGPVSDDSGWPSAAFIDGETEHMERFDPSRVLRQTAALRELADEARFVLGKNHPGLTDAGTLAESVLELLASIYPEDTTETGDRS